MLKVYYRISNNSYQKTKPDYITKEKCLTNFISCFPNAKIHIYADNVTEISLKEFIERTQCFIKETSLGNAKSFLYILETALESADSDDSFYFVEDDYLHLPGSEEVLLEGLQIADYISLYDHPDKYTSLYKNGELCKVMLTPNSHWKTTISTTMTFAGKTPQLTRDYEIFEKYCQTNHPYDNEIFHELRRRSRTLITPLPGYSTHGETTWLTPRRDWSKV